MLIISHCPIDSWKHSSLSAGVGKYYFEKRATYSAAKAKSNLKVIANTLTRPIIIRYLSNCQSYRGLGALRNLAVHHTSMQVPVLSHSLLISTTAAVRMRLCPSVALRFEFGLFKPLVSFLDDLYHSK